MQKPDLRSQSILLSWAGGSNTGAALVLVRRRVIYRVFQDVQIVQFCLRLAGFLTVQRVRGGLAMRVALAVTTFIEWIYIRLTTVRGIVRGKWQTLEGDQIVRGLDGCHLADI